MQGIQEEDVSVVTMNEQVIVFGENPVKDSSVMNGNCQIGKMILHLIQHLLQGFILQYLSKSVDCIILEEIPDQKGCERAINVTLDDRIL
jgi:hypothetical protein